LVFGDLIAAGQVIGPRIYGTGPAIDWSLGYVEDIDDARLLLGRYAKYWKVNTIKQYVLGDRLQRQLVVQAAREAGILPMVEGSDANYNLSNVLDGYGDLAHPMGVAPLYDDVLELMKRSGTSVQYQFGTLRGEGAPSGMYYFVSLTNPLNDEKLNRFTPTDRLHRLLLRRWEFPHQPGAVSRLWRRTDISRRPSATRLTTTLFSLTW